MRHWIPALSWMFAASGTVIGAVRPGLARERVRRLVRFLFHLGLRAFPRQAVHGEVGSAARVDSRAPERLDSFGYDADAVATAVSVLEGRAWRVVDGDPESAHDRLRMRGALPLLAELYAADGVPAVHERMCVLLAETRVLADARPSVGWDTTTAALRTISLLHANESLARVGANLVDELPWLRGFLVAHESVLAAGRVVEGLGNHRAINVAGRCAVPLLLGAAGVPPALATEFVETLEGQFLRDGGHIERAPHYHLQLLVLADLIRRRDAARGGRIGERIAPLLARANRALDAMTSPDGELLRFADASRPFTGSSRAHAIRTLRRGVPTPAQADPVRLDDFGIRTLRGRLGRHEWFVATDVGPMGLDGDPSHGHADTLAFSLHVDGKPCFVDPGTYLYRNSPEARWFKLPEAHNSIHWPENPSHELGRFFRWTRHPDDPEVLSSDAGCVSAEQRWAINGRRYRHRRTWTLDADRLTVDDQLETMHAESFSSRLILHPDAGATRRRNDHAVIVTVGGVELEVTAGCGAPAIDLVECHYAPEYGQVQPTVGLQWSVAGAAGPRALGVTCRLPA